MSGDNSINLVASKNSTPDGIVTGHLQPTNRENLTSEPAQNGPVPRDGLLTKGGQLYSSVCEMVW